ncbi:MAG: glycosyltransferase family 1 protein [Gammaproteobacteria bacterium]|nr:glycosyltransferase family 1 protein [Gammaproteobacteria bacterium]
MKLLVVTDAWRPQVNGVVTTLATLADQLAPRGWSTEFVHPGEFTSFPCPTYPEIKLSVLPYRRLSARIAAARPDALHIATEGPLGAAARRYCLERGHRYTSAYHTRFPEYVRARTRLPLAATYRWLRRFHDPAQALMVPAPAVRRDLLARGFTNTVPWTHGIDLEVFTPGHRERLATARPIFLYVGRVAIEKNISAFLELDLPGSKWVVGAGPLRAKLERAHPDVHFAGIQTPTELARFYRAADVFVFPSLTDTFGLVMLEALACGTPVAAYPVGGPVDVIGTSPAGVLDADLRSACLSALDIRRETARAHAERFSWAAAVLQFERYLAPFGA